MHTRLSILSVAVAVFATSTGVALAQLPVNKYQTYPANFENVEIRTLAEAVAAASGKTIVMHPKVEGQITLVSEQPLTGSQMYATFGQMMAVKGYVVADEKGLVKVYPGKAGKPDQ